MFKTSVRPAFAALLLAFAAASAPAAPDTPANPLLSRSPLQFQAPPFDRIRDTDYQPAIEEGMKQQLVEIAAIADNPEPPTFANTVEAMELSGELLTRAVKVFFNMDQSNTNDAIQKVKGEIAPKLAAHNDAIYLNPKLWSRVKSVYDRRSTLGLDPEAAFLLERYQRTFVRAGATLSEADKATLTSLNKEQAELTTKFMQRLLADTAASAVVVSDKAQLAGLSEGDLAAAAEAAKDKKLDGRWVLALQNTTQQPQLASLANRDLRLKLFAASAGRGARGDENDTTAIAADLARLRARKAKLLGYPNWAAYVLDDQMAKTPQNAEKLMTDLVAPATGRARREAAAIQKQIDAAHGAFTLGPADWDLYAEKVRKAEYDLDESKVRPYFELGRVERDGVFFAANRLYGVTFKERKDLPVYHPDVRVWEVFDADGRSLALYYADYYQRDNKQGGAWCDSFVDQARLLETHPVVVVNTNFAKPAAGEPALLSSDNVRVLFHEFGHALHGFFQDVRYPTLGNTPRDFVEFPSQFNEHWALEPSVFANYAKHYKTGEAMPAELIGKIRKSRTFNQGYATTEYLAAALLDMAWHTVPPDAPVGDVAAFEKAALERYKIALPQVPPRYKTPYFAHIWGGGYSAGYYAYLWSEVLDDDAYYWFKEHGGMTRANGDRFRKMILSRGGTQDAASLFRAFRGRDPEVAPLLQERGLVADAPSGKTSAASD